MAQKKFTQLPATSVPTGPEIAAWVQGGASVKGTILDIANFVTRRTIVSTATSTLTFDFSSRLKVVFVPNDVLASPQDVVFSNTDNAVEFDFIFQIFDVAAVITFPAGVGMNDVRWDSGSQEWTPDGTGYFKAHGVYNGSAWFVDISQSYS